MTTCREPAENLADNLLRDFETMWWTACKEASPAPAFLARTGGYEGTFLSFRGIRLAAVRCTGRRGQAAQAAVHQRPCAGKHSRREQEEVESHATAASCESYFWQKFAVLDMCMCWLQRAALCGGDWERGVHKAVLQGRRRPQSVRQRRWEELLPLLAAHCLKAQLCSRSALSPATSASRLSCPWAKDAAAPHSLDADAACK